MRNENQQESGSAKRSAATDNKTAHGYLYKFKFRHSGEGRNPVGLIKMLSRQCLALSVLLTGHRPSPV